MCVVGSCACNENISVSYWNYGAYVGGRLAKLFLN